MHPLHRKSTLGYRFALEKHGNAHIPSPKRGHMQKAKKNPAQGPGCNPATGAGPLREVKRDPVGDAVILIGTGFSLVLMLTLTRRASHVFYCLDFDFDLPQLEL